MRWGGATDFNASATVDRYETPSYGVSAANVRSSSNVVAAPSDQQPRVRIKKLFVVYPGASPACVGISSW